jgi:uncharacterized protein (DUF1501 family)
MGTLASASFLIPKFLGSFSESKSLFNKKLIVIQLSGGNDGLNTIVPYRNDIYYRSRPGIAIAKEKVLRLTDEVGLHPSLPGMRSLLDEGYLAILNSVGYPDPCKSHFRSMDIWQSGDTQKTHTGWLGRYLDNVNDNKKAVEIEEIASLALKGRTHSGFAFGKHDAHTEDHQARLAEYLALTKVPLQSHLHTILKQKKVFINSSDYPNTPLGNRMKLISSLISSRANSDVYYASHGSFDTHVNQPEHHSKLLAELDESISTFVRHMKRTKQFEDVMIVVFSEFGRRVMENDTKGTDHGAANNMFVISGGLKKPGMYNDMPDLADLDDGDIKHKIDFREVYATVLDKWLGADATSILGKAHTQHNFI